MQHFTNVLPIIINSQTNAPRVTYTHTSEYIRTYGDSCSFERIVECNTPSDRYELTLNLGQTYGFSVSGVGGGKRGVTVGSRATTHI